MAKEAESSTICTQTGTPVSIDYFDPDGHARFIGDVGQKASEKFQQLLTEISSCRIDEFKNVAGKLRFMNSYGYFEPAHGYLANSEPVDIQLFGGEDNTGPNPRSRVFKIVYWPYWVDSSQNGIFDKGTYLAKTLAVYQKLDAHSSMLTEDLFTQRQNMEAEVWLEVLPYAVSIDREIKDEYLKTLISKYEQLGPVEFARYFKSNYEELRNLAKVAAYSDKIAN